MNELRKKKIENEIVKVLSTHFVSGKVKDPRIGLVTVHRAQISPDMVHLKVWVTSYCDPKERGDLLRGLKSACGYLQRIIADNLDLRMTPRLQFIWDDEYIKAFELNQFLDNTKPKTETKIEEG